VSFGQPLLLLALAVVPAFVAVWIVSERRRARHAVRFTNVDVLAGVLAGAPRPWRRSVAPVLFLVAIAALCVAVARPRVARSFTMERATVMLVVDTSESMRAHDLRPSRLAVAREAVGGFLARVPKRLRVGLIVFSDAPQVAAAPTTDRARVRRSLALVTPDGGTAIGDALALAVRVGDRAIGTPQPTARLASFAPGPPKHGLVSIVFLSDGSQTAGRLSSYAGAGLARRVGFRVYTIALGMPNALLTFGGAPGHGLPVPPDTDTLKAIAQTTGGEFFGATSVRKATAAYSGLGSSLGRRRGSTEVSFAFLAAGALGLLGAGIASAAWSPRFP
jgi:Ca-activated chloride channel family protein